MNTAEKLKGQIPFPCCPKEKAMVYENSHGQVSLKCPRCGRFAILDFDEMIAYLSRAAKGASHKFKTENCID